MLYRICFEYCVPILSHFWRKLVCWELFKVLGSSHCPVGSTGQWLLPETSNSSQQTSFRQKWLKIGRKYSKHILYNISESHNFFKKCAHVTIYLVLIMKTFWLPNLSFKTFCATRLRCFFLTDFRSIYVTFCTTYIYVIAVF